MPDPKDQVVNELAEKIAAENNAQIEALEKHEKEDQKPAQVAKADEDAPSGEAQDDKAQELQENAVLARYAGDDDTAWFAFRACVLGYPKHAFYMTMDSQFQYIRCLTAITEADVNYMKQYLVGAKNMLELKARKENS